MNKTKLLLRILLLITSIPLYLTKWIFIFTFGNLLNIGLVIVFNRIYLENFMKWLKEEYIEHEELLDFLTIDTVKIIKDDFIKAKNFIILK